MRVLGSRRMCSCLMMILMFPAADMRQEVLLKLFSVKKAFKMEAFTQNVDDNGCLLTGENPKSKFLKYTTI
jgi:hypothetical protein